MTDAVTEARDTFLAAVRTRPIPREVVTPYGEHVAVWGTALHLADTLDQPTLHALAAMVAPPAAAPFAEAAITAARSLLACHVATGIDLHCWPEVFAFVEATLPTAEVEQGLGVTA